MPALIFTRCSCRGTGCNQGIVLALLVRKLIPDNFSVRQQTACYMLVNQLYHAGRYSGRENRIGD